MSKRSALTVITSLLGLAVTLGLGSAFAGWGERVLAAEAPPPATRLPEQKSPRVIENANAPALSFRAKAPDSPAAIAIGVRTYIGDAKILTVTPASLRPDSQFMVDISLTLTAPVSEGELLATMRVFIDAVEANRVWPVKPGGVAKVGQGGPAQTGAVAGGGVLSTTFTVTLFAMTPKELVASQGHTVSVYSELDQRSLSSLAVPGIPEPLPMGPKLVDGGASATVDGGPLGLFGVWGRNQYLAFISVLVGLTTVVVIVIQRLQQAKVARRLDEELAFANRRLAEEQSRSNYEQDELKRRLEEAGKPSAAAVAQVQPRPANLPARLFAQTSAGSLSLVIGPGVSAQAGLPTGGGLLLAVLRDLGKDLPDTQRLSLRKLLDNEGSDAMLEALIALLGRERIIQSLQNLLSNPQVRPSLLHRELALLPVRACIDMTWDDLSAVAFGIDPKSAYGPGRREGFSVGFRSGQKQLIKPYGSLADPKAMVLTDHEYRRQISLLPELQRSIAGLFSSQTLLFVGMSLKDIGDFLGTLPPELEGGSYVHYALIPVSGNSELWQAGLGKKFGIEVIEYSPSADFHEVPDAIAVLNAGVRPGSAKQIAELSEASAKVRYVQLDSIGIFRNIRVEFADGWTLLLGNNGGGKSTILRAIALALSGNDGRLSPLCARLLRSGQTTGTIEIGVGASRIVSTLVRDEQSVTVRSPQTTALQAGQMLVLAFPALRGVITTQPKGPTSGPALNPSVDDVLPLLQGIVDSRLNDLQQWLVNAVLRAEENPRGRDAQMLATFQSVIAEMVPGGLIKYSRLDRTLWTVYFSIDDVEVPFDGISQGMSSILNWVGVLLQRLYDVYPKSAKPEGEAALVLIDEIDAHLHPKWQRQLVTLSREKFPKVQVIATSHSPLLAGAVSRSELRIVERDAESGQITAVTPREDVSGQKVEDILTSSLFSLPTTRSPEAEKEIKRYFALFEKRAGTLSPEENMELKELGTRLQGLNYGPTRRQKAVHDEIKADIDTTLKTLDPAAIAAMQAMLSKKGGEK